MSTNIITRPGTKIKLPKASIENLLREVAHSWDVYLPLKKIGGDVWVEALPEGGEGGERDAELVAVFKTMALGDEDTVISPKDIFFPQLDLMFEFDGGNISQNIEQSPVFLFGVKACDLRGIRFADNFFSRNPSDIYYLSRIQERFIVTIGCLNPPRPDACFCTSVNTGPFAEGGYDLQLIDGGEDYFVEVGSKKGEEFLETFKQFFKRVEISNPDVESIKSKAWDSVTLKVDFAQALEYMTQDVSVVDKIYKRIGERCIYCGGCVYVCPTCTCFNVFDDTKEGEKGQNREKEQVEQEGQSLQGKRYRNWDACVFLGYTREASGHNPREERWVRASRRYEHKLKSDCTVSGMSGCIGCGRCLSSCPVNIGMSTFIQELLWEMGADNR